MGKASANTHPPKKGASKEKTQTIPVLYSPKKPIPYPRLRLAHHPPLPQTGVLAPFDNGLTTFNSVPDFGKCAGLASFPV